MQYGSILPSVNKEPGLVYRWSSSNSIEIHKTIGFKEVTPKVAVKDLTLMSISEDELKRAHSNGIVKLFRNEVQQLKLDEERE